MAILNSLQSLTERETWLLSRAGRIGANVVIISLWLWLYRPVLDYLTIIFSGETFRTNQLVLIGVVLLIARQIHQTHLRPRFEATPHLYFPALALALGGSAFYLIVERFLDINTLSATLFTLASYGLLGLWLSPQRWRQGLPAALLLVGTLPFGDHIQTFIGYPMRILTAAIVGDGLTMAGVASLGVDTILVLENSITQVDLPCSGVKSLWTGMIFLIAATWVERRPLNLRWLLLALIFATLLFTANLIRIGILVVVGQVAGWRLAAEMLHVPLGVLGFIAACAAALLLLRVFLPNRKIVASPKKESTHSFPPNLQISSSPFLPRPFWFPPLLAAIILTLALLYTPRSQTGLAQPPDWTFPPELVTEPQPLTADIFTWLTRDGAESVERRRFEWRGITGSMILITSTTWRAHHRPERCFDVYGLSLDDSRAHLINPDFPLRLVSLGNGDGADPLSAAYWFQSTQRTTDDYATRIWADLAPERERWVLVSILFDAGHNPHPADIRAFYIMLHNTVQRHLAAMA